MTHQMRLSMRTWRAVADHFDVNRTMAQRIQRKMDTIRKVLRVGRLAVEAGGSGLESWPKSFSVWV